MTAVLAAKYHRRSCGQISPPFLLCYATLAMVTDYDCWKDTGESVSVEMVVATMRSNTEALRRMLPDIIAAMRGRADCSCRHAAREAIMTDVSLIPYDAKRRLALFYGKYWGAMPAAASTGEGGATA